ncbi:copper chaperone PCu(A)C [Thiobacillus denitrificans]|uniref:copper chaperone PCu(A)C n=1 Tax=Thiobacillus denitrificans TaxID=36861 RepID=UPI000373580A|nr:copper chaperone PCu(A)C [Thiobacillus denitrificans]
MRVYVFSLLTTLMFATPVLAVDARIENAWVRPTVPGQKVAGAFMDISAERDLELVTVATPVAAAVELHFMRMDGERMEMRELESIRLPAGKTVRLEPGGLHAMLIGLKAPLGGGDSVPMTLTVRDGAGKQSTIEITLTVAAPRG